MEEEQQVSDQSERKKQFFLSWIGEFREKVRHADRGAGLQQPG